MTVLVANVNDGTLHEMTSEDADILRSKRKWYDVRDEIPEARDIDSINFVLIRCFF